MSSRDHSETCEVRGESYGGMNSDTEEHTCSDMVNVEESPGVYVYRKRRWGECFCHAYDDSECACGGLWERRETDRPFASISTCLRDAGALCAAFDAGHVDGYHEANRERGIPQDPRYPNMRDWRPGCGKPWRGGG